MTQLTYVKLVGITDREAKNLSRVASRLEALAQATGAQGAAWEAQFVTQLARRVERAFTIADYYDKFNDET